MTLNTQHSTFNIQHSTLLLLDTGHCLVSAHHVMRGAPRQPMACRALAALIGHPQRGWTLFDTGYAPRMVDATRYLPWRLYRLATPLHIRPEQAAVRQLGGYGLAPSDIRRVIISHFHADHVAGLRDFPHVPVIASAEALAGIAGLRGLAALRRAHLPALMPDDLPARAAPVSAFDGPPLPHIGPTHDLFGDGSLLLVRLPGHARGQIGALVQTNAGPVLLAADGAWTSQAIRAQRPPARVTHFFVDDARAVGVTLAALGEFAAARPEVRIVPTHCPEMVI
jgi:glyoxylase-like metal-dependent hydrolase (beta-lactamase superfamily II)